MRLTREDNTQGVVLGILQERLITLGRKGILLPAVVEVAQITVGIHDATRSRELEQFLNVGGVAGLDTTTGIPVTELAVLGVLLELLLHNGLQLLETPLIEHLLYRIPVLCHR